MEIKKLDKEEISDFRSLLGIFKVVFENDNHLPNDEHLSKLLSNPDFMVFVVMLNGNVVGGLTIYVLHSYYGIKPIAYIYDVGITPSFQRQGFGKALMTEVCSFCKENGFEDAYVEAEVDDTQAVNFYKGTPFSSELQATHFTYSFGK